MSPIKDFKLVYEALNKQNTFSEGDTVAGTVSFTLTEQTKVKCIFVKVKGAAHVHWSDGTGERRRSHNAHRKLFKEKEYLVTENADGTELPKGDHQYKFRLKIPQGSFPSSFKGYHGKIVYHLAAKISRSWHLPSVEQTELNFVSRALPLNSQATGPNCGSVGKEVGVFSKEHIRMSATVDKKVCSPGDTISIVANISNSSSKKMKPKFSVEQRTMYRAHASSKLSVISVCKMVGDTLKQSEETVSGQLTIPADVNCCVHNCDIISVEHYVKVYLDISFSIDPEVKLPLVIIPFSLETLQPAGAAGPFPPGVAGPYPAGAFGGPSKSDFPPPAVAMGPYPAGAVGAPSYSNFPPPAVAMGPYPAGVVGAPSYSNFPPPAFPTGSYGAPTAPGAYGYPAPGPTQPGNTAGGYNNQWPQQAPPYSFPTGAFPPPSVQHQGPTAPPQFQLGEDLPSYTSLYPPVPDTFAGNGLDKKN
ncbi:arrestin domain-containing protein 3-like [Acanthopagrus latus]|uniref:arrestin domain-containing protein 3-like n=1 Tax=Acanthopagrus latus TaxID=8177 RepID=UPI00187C5D51|nr:arrestin domain-containing protein 3-like [Acanthopagrus latus]